MLLSFIDNNLLAGNKAFSAITKKVDLLIKTI